MEREWISDCGTVRLICGDCLEVLPTLEKVDAVITDPPYNVSFEGEGWDKRTNFADDCARWLNLFDGVASCSAFTPGLINVATWCAIKPPKWIICWHKPAAMGRSPFGFCNWDAVLFYGKPPQSHGFTDVVTAPILTLKNVEHPCPKPVELMERLSEMCSLAGQTILDPFMGSGTTGVACVRTGRKFIGIEKEPKYFEIAKRRIIDELNRFPLLEQKQAPQQLELAGGDE